MSVAQMAVAMAELQLFVGEKVGFTYEGVAREVDVERIKDCKNGKLLIVGRDHGRNMAYRSFDVEKVQQIAVVVPVCPRGWDSVNV